MRHFSVSIPAGGSAVETCPGKVVSIKSASLPVKLTIGGGNSRTVKSGSVIENEVEFKNVNFINPNAVDVTLSFVIGDTASQYTPDDNANSNAPSYAYGNLGVPVSTAAANGLPQCDANGFLLITNAMALVVAGTNNGHRRQIITFSMSANSPAALNLLDANGLAFMTILAGQQIMLVTDSTFTLSGAGGTAWVTVGQIFLSA